MKNLKIIYVCLFIPFFVLMVLAVIKIKNHEETRQKVSLAQELHKVLNDLMFDLREAREDTIVNVPADGAWHDRIAFVNSRQGALEYMSNNGHLFRTSNGIRRMIADNISGSRFRRLKEVPDVIEVQIESVKNVTLISNLRIRIGY